MPKISPWLAAVFLGLTFLTAFSMRAANWGELVVDADQDVILLDADAPYHFLRIFEFAKGTRSQIQQPDMRTYAPGGFTCHWSPGFDFVLGSLGKLFYFFSGNDFHLKIFIAFLIPLMGALSVVAYYFFSRLLLDTSASLVSALIFALLPFHITTSYFALTDHHVAEFLILILFYWSIGLCLQGRRTYFLAAVLWAGFWVAPGFVLDFLVASGVLWAALLVTRSQTKWQQVANSIHDNYRIALVLLCVSVPFSYYGSRAMIRFNSLSYFHVCLLLCTTMVFTLLSWSKARNSTVKTAVLSAGSGLALWFFLILLLPELAVQFKLGFLFTQGSEHWNLSKEMTPLSWTRFTAGELFYLWPWMLAGLGLLLHQGWKHRNATFLTFALAQLVYGTLAIKEGKFYRYYLILAAAAGVYALLEAIQALRRFPRVRLATLAGLILASLLCLRSYHIVLHFHEDAEKDPPYHLLKYLAAHHPPHPGKEVLFAPWDIGHKILFYTPFSNMDNPFLMADHQEPTYDFARFNFATEEADALRLLEKYRADYFVLDSIYLEESAARLVPELKGVENVQTINWRLTHGDGTQADLPALAHFRLIYESEATFPFAGESQPYYKAYETVLGAKIEFKPKRRIKSTPIAEVIVHAKNGREFLYRTSFEQTGKHWSVTVPYAGTYHVSDGQRAIPIQVTEEQVTQGKTVRL